MNKRAIITLVLGAVTLVVAAPLRADDSSPVQLQYELEWQTASTNRTKCAFGEFVQLCTNKCSVYRRWTSEAGGDRGREDSYNGIGSGDGAHSGSHVEYYCLPATGETVCTNWSGQAVFTYWNNVSGPGNEITRTNTATMTGCDEWTWDPPGQTVQFTCPSEGCWSSNYTSQTVQYVTNYCRVDTSTENSVHYDYCSTWSRVTLSDEYTTGELISPGGFDYADTNWPSGGISAPATTAIGDCERSAFVQKMHFRFKVVAPPDAAFDILYDECFQAADSTNVIRTSKTYHGVGTGSAAYYPPDGPIEFAPPSTNSITDCTNIVGASRWVEVACGSLGSPCSACSATPGSFSAALADSGFYANVSLGSDTSGGSGSLVIARASPSPGLVTPTSLEYFGTLSGIELLRAPGGAVRQAKSPQALVNVVVNSGTSYTIQSYTMDAVGSKDQDGFYTITGSPFATATIAQGSSTNQVIVTVVNGPTTTYTYTWSDAAQGWTLDSSGLRTETRTWNAATLTRTNTIRSGSNQIVYQEVQYFQNLGAQWGNVMVKRVVGPQGPTLTTQWFYYANAQTDGTNFGKLRMVIEPSGLWRSSQYDTNGLLTKQISQFLNAPTNAAESQCRVATYDYTQIVPNCSCTCEVEKLLGQEIRRRYTLDYGSETWSIQCQTPGTTNLAASDNLVTVSRTYYDGAFRGKQRSTLNPDGTVQLYSYETSGDYTTTTVVSGQPDATGTNVVDGLSTVTQTGPGGEPISYTVTDIASGLTVVSDYYGYTDNSHRSYTVTHIDGTSESVQYACCGLDTTTDAEGTVTSYQYDALKRQTAYTKNGITLTNVLDAAGNTLAAIRIGTDSSPMTLRRAAYDTAGQITSETNALGGVTWYSRTLDSSGQGLVTILYPDGGSRITTSYQDGSQRAVTGTAVFPVGYEYGVEADGGVSRAYTKEIKLNASGGTTGEWSKNYSDMLGRTYKTVFADGASSRSFFNNRGQLWKTVDPDGVGSLLQYNGKGEMEYTAIDMNTNDVIDFAGSDRITRTVADATTIDGQPVRRHVTYAWLADGANTATPIAATTTLITGLHTWTTNAGVVTDTVSYRGSGQRQDTTYFPDRSYAVATWQNGQLSSVVRNDAYGGTISQETYQYDPHGRRNQVSDARNGATTYSFNPADQAATVVTPSPDGTQSPQTTTSFFDNMGRVMSMLLPDNTTVTNQYSPAGLLTNTFGSRTYPVAYSFDAQGRIKTMKTWQDAAGGQGAATTTWNYDTTRGWLNSKQYANGQGPTYTYTAGGRLKTRTWARAVTTTYTYNNAGDFSGLTYSDGTPSVSYDHDRNGRPSTATQGDGTVNRRTYDVAANLTGESYSGGPLAGLSVTNCYDQYLRRTNVSCLSGGTNTLTAVALGYDNASRLQTVADALTPGQYTATYTYLANSSLVGEIAFAAGGTTSMTTVKTHDYLNRLVSISSAPASSSAAISSSYGYNPANQRLFNAMADGSFWRYGYDRLGQVVSGKCYWPDQTPVAGQQFEYVFDDIGNRTSSRAGGDAAGSNLRMASYTANSLNQIVSRGVPPALDIMGVGYATNTVTANSQATYRKGDYFRKELPVNNTNNPVWTNITVASSGQPTVNGSLFLPKTREYFYYDADGNLTNDGRWTYTWDAENRLVTMTPNTSAGPRNSLKFTYDSQGRRIRKQVWPNADRSGTPTNDVSFLYDGWNLAAELNATNHATLRWYMWGLDLSGSTEGAGGVGGLLKATFSVGQATNCFAIYDGNGNVAALTDADGTNLVAHYEYGPFGEPLRATGPMAKANPFRFSTKYQDDETDLLYYGHRYYGSSTGGWLSRDPMGETAAERNLYAFVHNDAISSYDVLGLAKRKCGVEEFVVRWWPASKFPTATPTTMFVITVSIKFKKGGGYDPRCCEYKQRVKSGYSVRLPSGQVATVPVPTDMHDDNYSRSDDDEHRPITSVDFYTHDAPGLPSNTPSGSEVLWYEFTAEQIVYSSGKTFKGGIFTRSCECEKEDPVAKKGPHTEKVIGGKVPGPYKYEHELPITL